MLGPDWQILNLSRRAVKFFSEQRQFRFRVFRALSLCVSAALRETEYSLAEAQRRRDKDAEFLILKLPELSAGDCLRQAQAARDTG
ncbi:MAG: hypothetical protein B6245_04745 [Desulfobacteraceae bacterium 4572_88]|nr:MAG: hypothetical protein B6245_04745 [Desulfobacteraceae bacterium 4572_88]